MKNLKPLIIVITASLIFGILAGFYITYQNLKANKAEKTVETEEEKLADEVPSQILNAERDENGCAKGFYMWDEELGVCIRETGLDAELREVAKIAIDHVGRDYALSIINIVKNKKCEKCYKVRFSKIGEYYFIRVEDGEIVDDYQVFAEGVDSKIGKYTTEYELIYKLAVVMMGFEPDNVKPQEANVVWDHGNGLETYLGPSVTVENSYQAEEIAKQHREILDLFKELGFTTDIFNAISGSIDYNMTRLSNRDYICNVLITGDSAENLSKLQVSCVEY